MDPITTTRGLRIVRPETKIPVFITSVKEHKKKFKLLKPSYFLPLGWGGVLNFLAPLIVHQKKKSTRAFYYEINNTLIFSHNPYSLLCTSSSQEGRCVCVIPKKGDQP